MGLITPYWKTVSFDIAYGMHSQIPSCCIAFFVMEWKPIHAIGNLTHDYFNKIRKIDDDRINKGLFSISYIPCPDCLEKKKFVSIHICDKKCEKIFKHKLKHDSLPMRITWKQLLKISPAASKEKASDRTRRQRSA